MEVVLFCCQGYNLWIHGKSCALNCNMTLQYLAHQNMAISLHSQKVFIVCFFFLSFSLISFLVYHEVAIQYTPVKKPQLFGFQ